MWQENKVLTIRSWRRIFELRVWPTFETMRSSFATHATRNTTAKLQKELLNLQIYIELKLMLQKKDMMN